MLLSIIVPVYNVEDYIKTCIESLVNQDIDDNEYEILAINDGATDGSAAILEELLTKYSNLRMITQENQGLSGARNTGMLEAQGKYILFVDADDTIIPNCINNLAGHAENNGLDILEFGAQGITDDGKVTYTASTSSNGKVLDGERYLEQVHYISSACNKLYRKGFLDQHRLQFMPRVYIEDIEFNTRAVFLAQRIMAIDTIAAKFLQRAGSITRSSNTAKIKKMIYDIFTVLTAINNFTEKTVTENSRAYIPLKRRVSSLIATMLLRVCKETKDIAIAKDILGKLEEEKLYPTSFAAETSDKQWFLRFANRKRLFLIVTRVMVQLKPNKDA
ncbi:glycosyltransferase [Flagellimonas sp. HMM57]|uniref:glycosyltransferase n=1 Tax=unclassified Flagellimonas TaxID=2644544 RepID=UPI0013D32966|nr:MULTISPECIES: glycosyltransferase [unclassified Flagellimonas]UII76126.1 glycosyltransferase [Flagellimonas sp. HMM57]